jgi:hypothetical protein
VHQFRLRARHVMAALLLVELSAAVLLFTTGSR